MKTTKRISLIFSLLAITLLTSTNMLAGEKPTQDPELIKGVLPNGITYYIRHNAEPKDRASFYIIQNVGALLENDDQNGLAHFLEHMAFNGTEHFEGKGIINTLQHNGVEFGRNLNAYTSMDETVYNISEVPTTTDGLVDTCLLILHDWCNYLSLTGEEIDAERGVITEEWRTGQTASRRMRTESRNLMLQGSKHTERDVIGSMDIVQNFEYETLRNFYHDWYRTDLQAIAIVGDFDAAEMEEKVKALFSNIPAVEDPLERYYVSVPRNEEPIFGLVTDKEATRTSINVTFKHDQVPYAERDLASYRANLASSLYNEMLSKRFEEIMQQDTPPFSNAFSVYTEFVRDLDVYYIDAGARTNEEALALKGVMIENERARRYGFTAGELERAKLNYLTNMESAYKQRDKISNDNYAREYVRNYLQNESIPGIAKELEYVKGFLPSISLEEINALAKKLVSYEHMVVVVSGPEGEGIEHLNQEQAFSIINEVREMEIAPYEEEAVAASLMEKTPKASAIKSTKELPTLQAEEWTLKNGTKVVYRFSDIEKDQLYVKAISKGGYSLYDVADLPSAQMTSLVGQFGLADYDPTTLGKILAGKKVRITPSVSELNESISGSASPDDAESLFQMLYLSFENPRFDESIFNSTIQQYTTYVQNKKNDPKTAIKDSIAMINADYNPRTMLLTEEFLAQVSLEKIEKIYRERFADGNDFTFFITGNISKEALQPLVETYIGGISTKRGSEKWVDHKVGMPEGITKKDIRVAMETPKSTVSIKYNNSGMKYTPENIQYAKLLGDILNLRYTEKVREEAGGTYGVGVRGSMSQYPSAAGALSISFDCDPEKVKELVPIIYQELELIAKEGPTETDLNKVVVTSKKNRSQAFEKNGFWFSAMQMKYWKDLDIVSPSYYEDIINEISPKDIQDFTVALLKDSDMVELIFLPVEK